MTQATPIDCAQPCAGMSVGCAQSIEIMVPPLATVYFRHAGR